MKYFGEKSLSSFFAFLCRLGRYVLVLGGILAVIVLTLAIIYSVYGDILHTKGIIHDELREEISGKDWEDFNKIPLVLKMLIYPYLILVFVLAWKTLNLSLELFSNFKKNVLFNPRNVKLIGQIGKLLLIGSAITFNIEGIFGGLLVLLFGEVLKRGKEGLEEKDITAKKANEVH